VAAEDREFAERRAQNILRAGIRMVADKGHPALGDAARAALASANEISLANYAALHAGGTLWVHGTQLPTEGRQPSVLGTALAWSARASSARLDDATTQIAILDPDEPGVVVRRARNFSLPVFVLESNSNGSLAVPSPEPYPERVEAVAVELDGISAAAHLGAEVVVEHGVVSIEVDGLEIARVVRENGRDRLQMGVGAHDREMFAMVHGADTSADRLAEVVRWVAETRRPTAPSHPLQHLARERSMRRHALSDPASIGFATLVAVDPPVIRRNVKDSVPCCAAGRTITGENAIAVFSAGVDLDVVPFAVDARQYHDPDAKLYIVVEQRNIVAAQQRVASMVAGHAAFVAA
jgi:hypothetical protein